MAKKFLDSSPPPTADPVVGASGLMTSAWAQWFARMPDTLSAIPSRVGIVEATATGTSSGTLSDGLLAEGIYRATFYAQPAATVTFTWTDGGVARTWSATDTTGTAMFNVDADSSVTYTAVPSAGAYSFSAALERIKA